MVIFPSLLDDLLQTHPHLRPQIYFKASLTALSHAMEDQVLGSGDESLVIANFQKERYYRQETRRYRQLAQYTSQIYVLAAPETDFAQVSEPYETVPFDPSDPLAQEWHLVVLGSHYAACLVCRERPSDPPLMDQARRFEGIWTFDRATSQTVARLLLERIASYQPQLREKIHQVVARYELTAAQNGIATGLHPGPFVERLVTYLQSSQYKILKAYRALSDQERQQRLVNVITGAIRSTLNPEQIFPIAVQELGQNFAECRCILYRCRSHHQAAHIEYEYTAAGVPALKGIDWPLGENPLFGLALGRDRAIGLNDVTTAPELRGYDELLMLLQTYRVRSWLMAPIIHQGMLLGMLELHHCGSAPYPWREVDLALVTAIANQVGLGLVQAQAYKSLAELNQQLAALDRTRTNLIAIIGHELRTPLSTIQVCLESLATEPEMPAPVRQEMLGTAMGDAERLHKLIQDFLTLSRLESGRVQWQTEAITLSECVELALAHLRSRADRLPQIQVDLPADLPLLRTDGEGMVEVLVKLLDNACKFTSPEGRVTVRAQVQAGQMLEVVVADTGRGIEPSQLQVVFDRFYQEEGALRRTVGGTGLGLAICRQIVAGLGGQIWAESAGRGQGSKFHFTIPLGSRPDWGDMSRPVET
ncbi:GAF sensor signal transduction histidine kinase [Gloeomargarita lithophora Alchichica-D10]|uniref:histidine kinase n=1 Tax=Gloeomargarita lithophora Alchichica-D10 TaxID=1188229 RepID=A0A1J0A9V5_9CYAN|nr:DICT sensory domain-containing protein [Gloeomargarita lithophora]APB32720.1 GAF sensor signal transduction histidine kinase [Gloeomargarita lithophora Alchichica-D10]